MTNNIKIGGSDTSSFKVGSDDCKIYIGDTLVYEGGGRVTVPNGYTELLYAESVSNTCVNLGINPYSALTNSYELTVRLSATTDNSSFEYLISSENSHPSPYYGVGVRYTSGTLNIFGGSYVESTGDTTVTQSVDNGISSFTFHSDSVATTNNNTTFTLFCGFDWFQSNDYWRFSNHCRVYSLTYTLNGQVEMNLIPCKRDSDDVVGFYDTVYGTFHTPLSTTYPLSAPPTPSNQ